MIISLNSINHLIFIIKKCFVWGKKRIFMYYLDELGFKGLMDLQPGIKLLACHNQVAVLCV
jgi:hypothetical protein